MHLVKSEKTFNYLKYLFLQYPLKIYKKEKKKKSTSAQTSPTERTELKNYLYIKKKKAHTDKEEMKHILYEFCRE